MLLIILSFLLGCLITGLILNRYNSKVIHKTLTKLINNLSDMYYKPNEVPEEDKSMSEGYNCALDYVMGLLEELN